ncbi:hypothetical protein [uncultured Lactobacillus sp.]|uniref:hypothetical protein n=1 Tax=uncultured Lactobacillus sp. TaxID=153152 RepID=UPI00272BE378|nr:hypothetical protein [uncultured Lactobacillus sp.]
MSESCLLGCRKSYQLLNQLSQLSILDQHLNRGKKGAAIVNLGKLANFVDLPTGLPAGTYRDEVYGKEFKVKGGRLKGIAAPERSYILVKK